MSSYSVMICDHYKAYYKEKLLMNEITTLLTCMHPLLDINTYRHLLIISQALLMMTGRITMLGISRWTEKGCSYRTIQRFFSKDIPWSSPTGNSKNIFEKIKHHSYCGRCHNSNQVRQENLWSWQVFLFYLLTCSSWYCLSNSFIAGC